MWSILARPWVAVVRARRDATCRRDLLGASSSVTGVTSSAPSDFVSACYAKAMSSKHNARPRRAALAALLVAPLITACGAGQTGSSNAATGTPDITLRATDNKWDQPGYAAKAGKVTIALRNQGSVTHSLVVKDSSGTKVTSRILVPPGQSKSVEVDASAGSYTLLCDVPGHEATMHAQLTVG